ncbi:MAG: hypothetical protein LBQ15_06615 [Clostridium sp.]|jgi:hypothetical protein|nr:hypothetical protein [Clostridium sp.]
MGNICNREVLRKLLRLGLGVQVGLGILWMAANFTGFQEFGDSFHYVEVSRSLVYDEYTGIFYPLLIRLSMAASSAVGFLLFGKAPPYYEILYCLQLAAAQLAAWKLLESFGIRRRVWGAAALLTVPFAMQCHLAVLPQSLALSCLLLEIAGVVRLCRGRGGGRDGRKLSGCLEFGKILVFWLLSALLIPEYCYLALTPILVGMAACGVRAWKGGSRTSPRAGNEHGGLRGSGVERRAVLCGNLLLNRNFLFRSFLFRSFLFRNFLLLLAAAGFLAALRTAVCQPGSYGKIRSSISASAVSRFVWPAFSRFYPAWPEEVRGAMTAEQARQISETADGVALLFGPLMEEAVGVEEAKPLYRKMAATAFHLRTKEVVTQIAQDAISYTVAPWVLSGQLRGWEYVSYGGRNYEVMKNHAPGWTKWYVRYGGFWFSAGSVLALLASAARRIRERAGRRTADGSVEAGAEDSDYRGKTARIRPLAAGSDVTSAEDSGHREGAGRIGRRTAVWTAAGFVLYYTFLGAGMMDYKHTVFVTLLWYLWMVCEMRPGHRPARRKG